MAQATYTPISLYFSTTAAATPSAGNLVAGELALNTVDEKLYFKNSAGTVKLLASNASTGATVSSVAMSVPAFLSVAGSPITSSGTLAVTFSGTALPVANGGTALTAGTSGGVLAYTASGTLASSGVLAQYGVVIGGGAGAVPTSTAVGTATHVLTSNGAGVAPTFQALPASGTSFTAKTTTYTAVEGDTLLVDTSAGSFTITLPASPSTGKTVYFQDSKGTFLAYPLTIARNGNTIMGLAEDLTANSNNVGFGLVYNGSDWRIY